MSSNVFIYTVIVILLVACCASLIQASSTPHDPEDPATQTPTLYTMRWQADGAL